MQERHRRAPVTRSAISVEGQTEGLFVQQVLAPHLWTMSVYPAPIPIRGKSGGKGGNVTVDRLASDMAQEYWNFDFVTSLVDFYGFRGKGNATLGDLEQRISEAIDRKIGRLWDQSRVFPYIQQYEFEALLFSNVSAFADTLNAPQDSVASLARIRAKFPTPEDINDNPATAPSKRIAGLIPGYNKKVNGPDLAESIGLEGIRAECPRFDEWLSRLESLNTLTSMA